MNFLILDTSFSTVGVIDSFKSLLWVDRFDEFGDFEIYCSVSPKTQAAFKEDYYIWNSLSEHVMIIENKEIQSDVENGNHLVITGRSLESLLTRRIIWEQKIFEGNLQDKVQEMLNDTIIKPTIPERAIPNFIFERTDDPDITKLTMNHQYTGDDLYKVISELCKEYKIGFKITLNYKNQFVFKLYKGVDRSYNQIANPYVVFSSAYDNIINSNYYTSKENYKNVTLIAGEDRGHVRRTALIGSASGLNRRELFTDARDLSSETDHGQLSDERYTKLLLARGKKNLAEHRFTTAFEGKTETSNMFVYGQDFFIGDIVQLNDDYGHEGGSYISELVFSYDDNGCLIYPTFKMIEEEIE